MENTPFSTSSIVPSEVRYLRSHIFLQPESNVSQDFTAGQIAPGMTRTLIVPSHPWTGLLSSQSSKLVSMAHAGHGRHTFIDCFATNHDLGNSHNAPTYYKTVTPYSCTCSNGSRIHIVIAEFHALVKGKAIHVPKARFSAPLWSNLPKLSTIVNGILHQQFGV